MTILGGDWQMQDRPQPTQGAGMGRGRWGQTGGGGIGPSGGGMLGRLGGAIGGMFGGGRGRFGQGGMGGMGGAIEAARNARYGQQQGPMINNMAQQLGRMGGGMMGGGQQQGPMMDLMRQKMLAQGGGGNMMYKGGSQGFDESAGGNGYQKIGMMPQQGADAGAMQEQMGSAGMGGGIGPSAPAQERLRGQAGKEQRYQAILQARREGRDPYA